MGSPFPPPKQGDKNPRLGALVELRPAKWRGIMEVFGVVRPVLAFSLFLPASLSSSPPFLSLSLSFSLSLSLCQTQDEEPQDKTQQPVSKVIERNRLKMVRCPILVPT